jgi:ABC-type transport system involved in cytochrome bd biosynthesis fused ATPase/permease subunit
MVTHAIKFAHFADRIILMDKGRIIAEGDYETVSRIKDFAEIQEKI